jgi:thioredoxin 1
MTFEELIANNTTVLVDFYAEWCGPCQTMKPILQDVKTVVGDAAKIVKVDVDKYREISGAYQIRSIPTLILFKNGVPVWRHSGLASRADLLQILNKNK